MSKNNELARSLIRYLSIVLVVILILDAYLMATSQQIPEAFNLIAVTIIGALTAVLHQRTKKSGKKSNNKLAKTSCRKGEKSLVKSK